MTYSSLYSRKTQSVTLVAVLTKRIYKMMYEMEYECPCGEAWSMVHDCACNDRCPKCNLENEPVSVEDNDE